MYYSYLEDVYDSYFEDMNNNKLYHKLPNNCNKNPSSNNKNPSSNNKNPSSNNENLNKNINKGGGQMNTVEAKKNQDAINNQNDAIQNNASNMINILDGAGLKKNLLENENNYILLGLLLLFFVDCYYKF